MAIENNENKKQGIEQNGAAPKKKLNVVFRKQNSSSIKELPKGLKAAAGEAAGKKRSTQGEKSAKTGEQAGASRRRDRFRQEQSR